MVNVSGGQIELKVLVDITEVQNKLRQVGIEAKNVDKAITTTNKNIEKSGEQAAASAVRFQTLTQGAINLTTAFIQTETTVSNLARAKTSLKAAMVGVERANDLLIRKQTQLREEQGKAIPNMNKIKLLTNEIATAQDDLIVKQDRVVDQTDALNDTYKLFALNLLNVSFSAVQTGKSMFDMVREVQKSGRAITLLNATTKKYTIIALAAIAAWEIGAQALKGVNKELGEQLSIIDNVNRIFSEFGSVTETNLKNYETSIAKATESTKGFGDSFIEMTDDVEKQVKKQKNAADEWAEHWAKRGKEAIAQMRIDMGTLREAEAAAAGGTQGNFNQAQQGKSDFEKQLEAIWNWILTPPFNTQTAYAETYQKTNIIRNNQTELSAPVFWQQQANQRWQTQSIRYGEQLRGSTGFDTSSGTAVGVGLGNIFTGVGGGGGQIKIPSSSDTLKLLQDMQFNPTSLLGVPTADLPKLSTRTQIQQRLDILNRAAQQIEQNMPQIQADPNMGRWLILSGQIIQETLKLEEDLATLDAELTFKPGFTQKPFKTESQRIKELRERHLEKFPAFSSIVSNNYLFRENMKDIRNYAVESFFDQFRTKNYTGAAFRGQVRQQGSLFETGNRAIFFGGSGGFNIVGGMVNGASFGQFVNGEANPFLKNLELEQLRQLGAKGFFLDRQRRGADRPHHRTNVDVSGFEVDRGMANAAQMSTLGLTSTMGALPPALEGIRFSQAAISAGFVDANSMVGGAIRFAQRNNQALRNRKAQIQIEDQNRNKLRTGGVRNPDFPLWDPRAVEGGYTSISLAREAWRREFNQKTREATGFAALTGGTVNRWNRGQAINAMNSTRSLLARTGYTLSQLPTFGDFMPKRAGGGIGNVGNRYHSIMANIGKRFNTALANTIASNRDILARAGQVDLLYSGYDLAEFIGSALSFQQLQERVAQEDSLMKSIGLTRTEAFKIIDTGGRGREEVDDRILWTQRNTSISTGVAVI